MKRIAIAVLLALAACSAPAPSPGPERVVEERPTSAPAPRGDALLRRAMLDGHNRARAEAGVPALRWNDALAADARAYAETMARTGNFAHSAMPRGNPSQGENLWRGTRDAYRYTEMIGHWIEERRYFRRGITPDLTTTGRFEDVGHYVQAIWRGTTEFGCALASNDRDDFLVCRYTPPGNVVGVDPLG